MNQAACEALTATRAHAAERRSDRVKAARRHYRHSGQIKPLHRASSACHQTDVASAFKAWSVHYRRGHDSVVLVQHLVDGL